MKQNHREIYQDLIQANWPHADNHIQVRRGGALWRLYPDQKRLPGLIQVYSEMKCEWQPVETNCRYGMTL